MNRFDAKKIALASGTRDGDYIELSNQWAKVVITYDAPSGLWVVSGDLADTRARAKNFALQNNALTYALLSLAAYQSGRAD
jgi:hypothetical protein